LILTQTVQKTQLTAVQNKILPSMNRVEYQRKVYVLHYILKHT